MRTVPTSDAEAMVTMVDDGRGRYAHGSRDHAANHRPFSNSLDSVPFPPKAVLRRIDAVYRVVHWLHMKSHRGNRTTEHPLLSVVDDDEMLRESLPELLRELGFAARAFSSGQEFLSSDYVDETRCLILDVAMPRMSGLDLQQELKRRGQAIPIILITGHKDEEIRKRAFRQGAVKFLYKPFSDSDLLDAVNAALSSE
jgi:CheY-like chemotaxis protein